jgi:catechol 2,3-dioxygenase-like lactoylglutathione lyase family enzyme
VITGVHALIYTNNPDATRAFFRDVLGFASVDAGDGWLIFALPPAELGIHPTEGEDRHELYLMCTDIEQTMADLSAKGVEFSGPLADAGFGRVAALRVPGAGELHIYQPRHPTAIEQP